MSQPQQIGKYEITARLGGGGMAEVFAARLMGVEGFARAVAIKRVLPGYAQDSTFAAMFIQEAQLSARFNHPNVVSVLDFDRDPEQGLYLAMEMVEGRDLSALMQTGLLPIPVAMHVIVEVLRGLGYAHHLPSGVSGVQGVIHRDVSPHNVLLSWEGAVKVSDFGIAKARGAATSASASMMVKGKPAYMSPEQANGARLDGRSDLFAVGVMLWELLVGRPLFAGGTMHEMFAALFFSKIPSPRDARPEVPEDLAAVTMRLLARPREQRYATAEDAVEALLACAAAPRNGRGALIEVLHERFPGLAPVRPSRAFAAVQGTPTSSPGTTYEARPAWRAPTVRRLRLLALFFVAGVAATAVTLAVARTVGQSDTGSARMSPPSTAATIAPTPSGPGPVLATPEFPATTTVVHSPTPRTAAAMPGQPATEPRSSVVAPASAAPPRKSTAATVRTRSRGTPAATKSGPVFSMEEAENALQEN